MSVFSSVGTERLFAVNKLIRKIWKRNWLNVDKILQLSGYAYSTMSLSNNYLVFYFLHKYTVKEFTLVKFVYRCCSGVQSSFSWNS